MRQTLALFIWLISALGMAAGVAAQPSMTGSAPSAMHWQTHTPHWSWGQLKAGEPAKIVFILNYRAGREAAEFAQRFNADAWLTPVLANSDYRNVFDEKALIQHLEQETDLIVVGASMPGRDLSPAAQQAIQQKVAQGTPLLLIGYNQDLARTWELWKDLPLKADLKNEMLACLPTSANLRAIGGIQVYEEGPSRVVMAGQFRQHFTYFETFQLRYLENLAYPWALEHGYAVAGWAAKLAMHYPRMPASIQWQRAGQAVVHQPLTMHFTPSIATEAGDTLAWEVFDGFEQPVSQGEVRVADSQLSFTPSASGSLLIKWQWRRGGDVLSWGVQPLEVGSPAQLRDIEVISPAASDQPALVKWTVTGSEINDRLVAQVYDPLGRLVRTHHVSAAEGQMSLQPWRISFTTYQLRLVLMRGEATLAEHRQWLTTPLSREDDYRSFRVILWSNEQGRAVERFRYPLMREMGIDTLATVGRNLAPNIMASRAGLRLLPTNVLVPPGRHTNMKTYDATRDEQSMARLAESLTPYTPLGYSLADEPAEGHDLFAWHDKARKLIDPYDATVPVGYCGVWLNTKQDVPRFFRETSLAELYSPLHLYTPNLWLGTERDLMRSFRRPDMLLTCWSHYVTSRDNEAYARTVPWLWLFEGMNGVSYFCSAYDSFTTLEPTLEPAHDMRWAMQELREIQQGAGHQILSMQRHTGQVRVLFIQNSQDTTLWARALNQLNIPWRYTTPEALKEDASARLIICPSALNLSQAQLQGLEHAVNRGATLLAVSPLGVFEGQEPASPDRLEKLFGVQRAAAIEKVEAAQKELTARTGAAVRTTINVGPWTHASVDITGRASGEFQLNVLPGQKISRWSHIGDVELSANPSLPDLIEPLKTTPALVVKDHTQSQALLLTFTPSLDGAKAMLPPLVRQAGIAEAPAKVMVNDQPTDEVYLFPWESGDIHLLGVVADYWRIKPVLVMNDRRSADYLAHGRHRWQPIAAKIQFPVSSHLYDARAGKYLGQADSVSLDITPGQPILIAHLPYEIQGVELSPASTSLRAGQTLKGQVRMMISQGRAQGHKLHLALSPPEGSNYPPQSMVVTLEQGQADFEMDLPFNAPAGDWQLCVRDFISGKEHRVTLHVSQTDLLAGAMLPEPAAKWQQTPSDLPEGQWTDASRVNTASAGQATAKVTSLRRAKMHIHKDHHGHEYLTGNFILGNEQIQYTFTYSVCNDSQAHGESDPRVAWAPYLPGLGISRPQPHIFFYNSYIHIYINGKRATVYRLSDLAQVERTDDSRQVDVVWDTPHGVIRLASAMNSSQRGIYQKLTLRSDEPIREVRVVFSTFPQGFDNKGKAFYTIDPEHQNWVLMGDSVNDRAFFPSARGPGGLLINKEQWTQATLTGNPTLHRTFTDQQASQEVSFNWVLWLFHDMTNTEALDYLRLNSQPYQQQMDAMFDPRHYRNQP